MRLHAIQQGTYAQVTSVAPPPTVECLYNVILIILRLLEEGIFMALNVDCRNLTMRGLDAKRVISQKVKIEFLPVLCCHVVDSSTLKVL